MSQPDSQQSHCPICSGETLPEDTSVARKEGERVVLRGRVHGVIHPDEAGYTPFSHYCTTSLYPRRGPVKYLKFRLAQDMDRLRLKSNDRIQVEGCRHIVDGKELVFDVNKVVLDPLT
jgi:hypothetical protein